MVTFEENISVETPERLLPGQLAAVADLTPEQAAVALNTTPAAVETSRIETSLADATATPFVREDVEAARRILLSLALTGSSEAIQYRAACRILDDATVKTETRFKAKSGLNHTATVNNIIVAVNKAKELADAS